MVFVCFVFSYIGFSNFVFFWGGGDVLGVVLRVLKVVL